MNLDVVEVTILAKAMDLLLEENTNPEHAKIYKALDNRLRDEYNRLLLEASKPINLNQ